MARRTVKGTSAAVATNSQTRPLRTAIHISEFRSHTASENSHHRTCFQSMRPKAKAPPPRRRERIKPMSMMRSNTTSVTSAATTLGLVASKFVTMQKFASGDHVERTYGCNVSLTKPKQSKLKIHPYDACDTARFIRDSPMIGERYLPLIWNPMSVIHMAIAIPVIILSLFQMAILPGSLSALLREI